MEGRSDCPGDSGWLAGVLDVVVALCVWAETAVGVLYMNVRVCVLYVCVHVCVCVCVCVCVRVCA